MENNEKSLESLLADLEKETAIVGYRVRIETQTGILIGYLKSSVDDGEYLTKNVNKAADYALPRSFSTLQRNASVARHKQSIMRLIEEECIMKKKNTFHNIPFRSIKIKIEWK